MTGDREKDFIDFTVDEPTRRFLDTESKIFREFEDIHLKQIIQEIGAKSVDELRIEVSLQTVLDPCVICQGLMSKFQKLYNAKIKIYSSGAKDEKKFKEIYPKYEIIKPQEK